MFADRKKSRKDGTCPCRICFADVGGIMQLQRVQLDYLQCLSIFISFKFDNKGRYSQSNLKITVSSGSDRII